MYTIIWVASRNYFRCRAGKNVVLKTCFDAAAGKYSIENPSLEMFCLCYVTGAMESINCIDFVFDRWIFFQCSGRGLQH